VSEHHATIEWQRDGVDFRYDAFRREHSWSFAGGHQVPASSAPDFLGDPSHVDPEEAFVASLSSCHMLTFLALAARKRLVVDSYRDEAVGVLEKNAEGHLAMTRVVLRPRIAFGGQPPDEAQLEKLHGKAHEHCFIANSVRTEIVVESS
jgi:organic hydroperoxide reductase OsmC/OhrA